MRILVLAMALCFAVGPSFAAAAKRKNPNYSKAKKRRSATAKKAKKRVVKHSSVRHN